MTFLPNQLLGQLFATLQTVTNINFNYKLKKHELQ